MAPVPSKASVLLRVHPDAMERMQQQRAELRALVAASVDGLNADDVVLVIDAVVLPAPVERAPAEAPSLRPLVIAMGAALSLVALLVVFLAWRLQQAKRKVPAAQPTPTPATPAPPRPVINPAVQRKVA
jgi:type III secretory pathway lipoprotein EscJ